MKRMICISIGTEPTKQNAITKEPENNISCKVEPHLQRHVT